MDGSNCSCYAKGVALHITNTSQGVEIDRDRERWTYSRHRGRYRDKDRDRYIEPWVETVHTLNSKII